jgi:hypothetical protein
MTIWEWDELITRAGLWIIGVGLTAIIVCNVLMAFGVE